MKQEDIKYVYEIESTIELEELIDSIKKELKLKQGTLMYFSHSDDDLIKENLPIKELKEKALEIELNEESPSLIFPNVEVNAGDGRIEILSKVKLELLGVDVDNIIEK